MTTTDRIRSMTAGEMRQRAREATSGSAAAYWVALADDRTAYLESRREILVQAAWKAGVRVRD